MGLTKIDVCNLYMSDCVKLDKEILDIIVPVKVRAFRDQYEQGYQLQNTDYGNLTQSSVL